MQTQLVVLQGDITQLNVDAIVEGESLEQETPSGFLGKAYRNALLRGVAQRARSIAFPCIGGGVKDFPRSEAVAVALKAVRDFLEEYPGSFSEIIFACWDPENYHLYKEMLGGENRIINIP
jgi:O-acetyl-ADP-ribose deacetylase (regulator of RNase III)